MNRKLSITGKSLGGAVMLLIATAACASLAAYAAISDHAEPNHGAAADVNIGHKAKGPSPAAAHIAGVHLAADHSLHLTVGRSMLLNTESRIRRIFISNPDVVASVTATPWQVVVSARTAGASSIIVWDESGASQTYFVSADIDVEGLERAFKEALPGEILEVAAQQDRVSLSGSVSREASAETALKLAALYSKNIVNSLKVGKPHAAQVQLKVRIVEVDRTKLSQTGFNFFTAGKNTANFTTGQFPSISSNQNSSSSNSGSSPTGSGSTTSLSSVLQLSDPLNLLYFNNDLGVGEAIKALEQKQVLQILAEPTITTISGEKASFLSGGEFPFPVVQGGTGGFTSVTVQFRPYGVKLDFTPVVTAEGTIQLKVSPEVSALDFSNAVTISGYTIPALATRRAETQVELRDGQSFAISGLLDHRTTDLLEKTPGIGDIPILGYLFRSKNTNHSVVELMVIVTPSVVDPLSEKKNPEEPKMPVPMMNPQVFDRRLPGSKRSLDAGGSRP